MSYAVISKFPIDQVFRCIRSSKHFQDILKKFINTDTEQKEVAKQMKIARSQKGGSHSLTGCSPEKRRSLNSMIKKLNRRMNITDKKLTELKVVSIGFNNMCHFNAERIVVWLNTVYNTDEFKSVKGYNIFTCHCGDIVSAEIHSVIKYKDEYMDITEDYDDDEYKYFLECELMTLKYAEVRYEGFIREIDFWATKTTEHFCRPIRCQYPANPMVKNMKDFDDTLDNIGWDKMECKEGNTLGNSVCNMKRIILDGNWIDRYINPETPAVKLHTVSKNKMKIEQEPFGGMNFNFLTIHNKEDMIAPKCGHRHHNKRDIGNDNCWDCDMNEIYA